jgi:hypothetical protein
MGFSVYESLIIGVLADSICINRKAQLFLNLYASY